MTRKDQDKTDKSKKGKLPHDGLVKRLMDDPRIATEFFEEYLPPDLKEKVNLSTLKPEKESYVEESLKKRMSDIVYSFKLKNNEEGFAYLLLEHQSSSDYWISFRLWRYTLLLLERHKKGKKKLPMVIPFVIYNGKVKYTAPRSFWELFYDPQLAKESMSGSYGLLDLQALKDDDINYDKHLSLMLYVMKHVHKRDTLAMLKESLKRCRVSITIDKTKDYIITKAIIWYTSSRLDEAEQKQLEQLVTGNLPKKDGEYLMGSIAQKYIEEGVHKGISIGKQEGISIGKQEGISIGEARKARNTAIKMLKLNTDIKFISSITDLSISEINKLKNSL